MEHMISKRLKDKVTYVAWFRFKDLPKSVFTVVLKFGIWNKAVKFGMEELRSFQQGRYHIVSVKSNSMTLKSFKSVKVEWFSRSGKSLHKGKILNSGKFEDLADPNTFLKAEAKLKEVFG